MDPVLAHFGIQVDYSRELLLIGLIFARTMPMVIQTPFLAGQLVPSEVKMGVGMLFTVILWPLARESLTAEIPYEAFPFTVLMLKETFIGFCIGFVNSHIFWIMDVAGRLIDTARGTSMAEVQDPHTKKRETVLGEMYFQLMLIFFVALGGHHIFLNTFFYSFAAIPLNEMIPVGADLTPFFNYILRLSSDILLMATLLAAPAIAATLITDIVFGILNRVAPQLNAYFMAMPVKAMGGLIMVLIAMEPFIDRLEHYTIWMLDAVGKSIQLLSRHAG